MLVLEDYSLSGVNTPQYDNQQASTSNHPLEITSGVFQISLMGRHPASGKTLDIMFAALLATRHPPLSHFTLYPVCKHCIRAKFGIENWALS